MQRTSKIISSDSLNGLKSGAEPSIVPMWIPFPNLPICFFQDYYLRSIANVVGKVLLIDGPTPFSTRCRKGMR